MVSRQTSRKIIFASAHRFKPIMRFGTSYLAEAMAKRGWDVLYIEQPTSPFHLLHPASRGMAADKFRKAFASAWPTGKRQGQMENAEREISVLNVISLLPHVNFPPFGGEATLDHWWRATFPSVTGEIARRGFGDARALMFDSPFFFPLALKAGIPSVYRYADRMSSFAEVTPAMLKLQEQIFADASLVVYTAQALLTDMSSRQGPLLYLPNGVDLDAYRKMPPEPAELAKIARPRVIYSGTIGTWFDVRLVRSAAEKLAHVQFVVLGKVPSKYMALADRPNIHLLGEKPFSQVPEFLMHCQAAIIPFDADRMPDLVGAINPLKLYEYCAAGLPVITYPSEEIAAVGAPVDVYDSPQGFIELVRRAVEGDTPERRQDRQAWAATASWNLRAAQLEKALGELLERVVS